MLANLRPQINATFDHPQNIVFVHLLHVVSNCSRLYTEVIDSDHLIQGSVHRRVTFNFSHATYIRHGKFSTSAIFKFFLGGRLSGHQEGFSRILGSSEQSVKVSLPLGVGGGFEKNNTSNYLACTLFTITKKCIFFSVCLTNAVPKRKELRRFYVFAL